MSHPFKMVPMLNAENLPSEVIEWCLDHDYPLHLRIVQVNLDEENPMQTWLTGQSYQFSQEEIDRGWGYVAIFGD